MAGAFEALSGAKGIRAAGKDQQIIADYNAKVAEQNAKAERLRSEFEQQQQAKEAERIKGAMAANIGAAGGTGTAVALDITGEQAAELELENLLIGYEGETRAQQHESQAAIDRMQGKAAMSAAKSKARQANIGFGMQVASLGASFLGGGGGGGGASPAMTNAPSRFTAPNISPRR